MHFVLDVDRIRHHVQSVCELLLWNFGLESSERFLSVGDASFAVQPPGRFWSEEDSNCERYWERPLESEWNAVCPLAFHLEKAAETACACQVSDRPAHRNQRSEIWTQHIWRNFRCIGRCNRLEHTPRHAQ